MLSTRNLRAGDVLDGRYRLERRVGGGGMGDVWQGTDTILWRTVAVKILLADLVDDRGFRERFRREARAIATMKGPGVVDVYDYGEIDDGDASVAYLVMEYVDGKPLSRLLGLRGKFGSVDTLRIVGGVAQALKVAHAAGIVHRDIKPGNILVRDDGSVVLVDFGIARASHNLTLTTTGVVLGTVTYMSPEQAAGENLTAASDLYSLGVVAHQCLAGTPPFKADTPLGVLSAHLRNDPPPLPPEVPRDVADIVVRALRKDPAARWPDAAALAEACHRARDSMVAPRPRPAAPVSPPTRIQTAPPSEHPGTGAHTTGTAPAALATAPPKRRRGRLWVAFASTLAVLATAAAIAAASPWHEPPADGGPPTGGTGDDDAGLRLQDGDGRNPADAGGDDPVGPTESPTPDQTPTDEPGDSGDDPSGPLEGGTASTEPSRSPSPTESPSPTQAPTVTVPGVVNHPESTARQRVEEAGLTPAVVYSGEGDHKCDVIRQSPSAGSEVEEGSTVQLTVQRAADGDSCRKESEPTGAPGGE